MKEKRKPEFKVHIDYQTYTQPNYQLVSVQLKTFTEELLQSNFFQGFMAVFGALMGLALFMVLVALLFS